MTMRQRRLLFITLAVLATPLLALLIALALVQTPPGKRFLAETVNRLASSPEQQVKVEGITGFLPFEIGVAQVEVADPQGVWLTARNVELEWSPLAMLRDHLKIGLVRAEAVEVVRQPVEPADKPRRSDEGAGAGLPGRIDVGAVEIGRLTLGPELAGETASWTLSGNARVAGLKEHNWLVVKAERSDGGDGVLDLNGRYDGEREILTIKLNAREGAATVNRLTPMEVRQGIVMQADIEGPLDDLNGTLAIDAGDLLKVDGQVRAQREGNATRATLSLNGRAGELGEAAWLDAVQGDWRLQADGTFDAASITVQRAELQGPPGRLDGSGRIDRRDDTGDLSFTLDAVAATFASALPGVSWQTLTAKGRLTGKLMQPVVAAIVSAEGVRLDEVAIGRATVNIDGALQERNARAATLTAELDDIVLPAANGRSLTTRASLSAAASQTGSGPIVLRDLKLESPVVTAEGSGEIDPERPLPSLTLRAAAADLAVFAEALDQDIAGSLQLSLQTSPSGDATAIALDSTLQNGRLPGVPERLLVPQVSLALRGALAPDQAWQVQSLVVESGTARIASQGRGTGRLGDATLNWRLTDLSALDPQLAGRSEGSLEVSETAEALTAKLRGVLADARIDAAEVPRLTIELDARRAGEQTAGTLALDGEMQNAPIRGGGDFAVSDDGRAVIRQFDLRWASLSVVGNNFTVAETGTTGELAIKAERLQDLSPFVGSPLAGSLDATVKAADAQKIALAATVQNFRFADQVAMDRGRIEGEVSDPLGKAEFTLTATAAGSQLAGPLRQLNARASGERAAFGFTVEGTGENLRATSQGRVAMGGNETAIDLQSLNATYAGQTATLAGPARIVLAGDITTIERFTLRAASGTVTASGTVGPDSRLDVRGNGLPLSLLQAFDPTLQLFGVANFTANLRGPIAQPAVEATLDASDLRLRTIRTAGIPPGALSAKLSLRNNNATFDGRFTAGQGNALSFSGAGPLPGPGGVSDGRVRVEGGMNLAQFTPFLAGNGRLSGRLNVDVTFTATRGAIGGNGAVTVVDGRYFNLAQGIAFRNIDATIGVNGDRLEIRNFTARPRGNGTVTATGYLQVDPQLTLPVDVTVVADSARILDRRDMEATLSANLRLQGSVRQGMALAGTASIERAEINLDASVDGGPDLPVIDVREVNRPGGQPDDKPPPARVPGPETTLAVKVDARQAVFVRGRGLDVELGGALDIGGTLSRPQILGGLQLRRGSFSGVGRRMEFTRGTITFPDPDRLDPAIDFTATTPIEGGTAEIRISGRPSAPRVAFSSTPALPQDEIMAQILFGRSTTQLSPLQLAEIGQSIGSLSGLTGSGGGVLDRLRKAMGFDRLGVSSDPNAAAAASSPLGGSSLEVGRYVAPGVYLGAKQGATSGSSTAVVEIELTPQIKVQSEIGSDARSKVGVAIEWDY